MGSEGGGEERVESKRMRDNEKKQASFGCFFTITSHFLREIIIGKLFHLATDFNLVLNGEDCGGDQRREQQAGRQQEEEERRTASIYPQAASTHCEKRHLVLISFEQKKLIRKWKKKDKLNLGDFFFFSHPELLEAEHCQV